MDNHVVIWSYWSIWKPPVRIVWERELDARTRLVEPEDAIAARGALGKVMTKVRAGAAPKRWADSNGLGYC